MSQQNHYPTFKSLKEGSALYFINPVTAAVEKLIVKSTSRPSTRRPNLLLITYFTRASQEDTVRLELELKDLDTAELIVMDTRSAVLSLTHAPTVFATTGDEITAWMNK